MTVNLKEIADLVAGQVLGDPATEVSGVSSIGEAGPGDLVFAESLRHLQDAQNSPAAAVLTRHQPAGPAKPAVMVKNPREAFAAVLELFAPKLLAAVPGVHPGAHVAPTAEIAKHASIGFGVWIGEHARIGEGAVIMPLSYIDDGVVVGDYSVFHPHVTIKSGTVVGKRVILHSGVVIGADGFGYNQVGGAHKKIPHIGGVIIEDDVEIGANSTVDRSRTGFTEIGSGTKIDNLVHVAHNVKIGKNCIVVAQVGISGSVVIGHGVIIAGQAGIKDNVKIGDGVQIAARSGIISDIASGAKVAGFPARSYGDEMRIWACLSHLPALVKQVKTLEARIVELENLLEDKMCKEESGV